MRRRWWRGLPVLVLTALPVLLLSPFPTQDGPAHLYGGYLLRHLGDPDSPVITHAFEYSSSALATWTTHGLVAILLGVVSPFWVEKLIVLAFLVALFAVFVAGGDGAQPPFFPLCALPLFAMSFALRMGFYSFCLSMPLAIYAVALWTARGAAVSWRRRIGAACLLAVLPLLHLLAAGWALALMGAGTIGSGAIHRELRLRELGLLALAALPFVAIAAGFPPLPGSYVWESPAARVAALIAGGAFVGAGPHALWWSAVPSAGLLALGLLYVRDELRRTDARTEGWPRVVVLAAALGLALVLPDEGAGGAYIGVRCNLLFFLLLLLWLGTWRLPARVDAVLSVAFLAFSLVHVSSTYTTLQTASAAEREIVASGNVLRNHATALVVVGGDWVGRGGPTLATQVRPLLHAGDLLGVGADREILTFYEGELPYFPVNFRRAVSPWGILFDRSLFGWQAPAVRWDAVPTWRGGVEYVGVWDPSSLLRSPEGERFRDAMCRHYVEVYRSDASGWAIYQLRRMTTGAFPTPQICRAS